MRARLLKNAGRLTKISIRRLNILLKKSRVKPSLRRRR
jgi:hypothetical protein